MSGFDKLAALRLAALGGSLGQEYSAEDRADAEDVLMASAPILADAIATLRTALEADGHNRDGAYCGAHGTPDRPFYRNECQCCQALATVEAQLAEAMGE